MNDRAGLEIRYTLSGIGGLNPSPSAKKKGLPHWQAFSLLFLDSGSDDLSHLGHTLIVGMDAIGLYQFFIIQH